VGPGAVLRDLIDTGIIPVTILEQVVRQAGMLKENSTAILFGDVRPTTAKPAPDQPADWYVVGGLQDPQDIQTFIAQMYETQFPSPLPFDPIMGVQVLTPTHKGPAGTIELNRLLQIIIQRKVYNRDVDRSTETRKARPLPGDKVIQIKNDYGLDLMNGTVGILREGPLPGPCTNDDPFADVDSLDDDTVYRYLELDDGTRTKIDNEAFQNLELAYALTIHKAQGSEFPCCIVVCHKSHSFMHHRNLLYTAVTRAQKCAVILGDSWGIRNCAIKVQANQRRTFLPVLLQLQLQRN